MTIYDVHIYREMRLVFEGIEADSHERRPPPSPATSRPATPTTSTNATATRSTPAWTSGAMRTTSNRMGPLRGGPAPHRRPGMMLEALTLAQQALNTAPRFRVGDTDSYTIAAAVEPVPRRALR